MTSFLQAFFLCFRLFWILLRTLPRQTQCRWLGQTWLPLLLAQLLYPLCPHLHPEAGGQGEVRHRGLNWWRCLVLFLLCIMHQLPDSGRDWGEGWPQLRPFSAWRIAYRFNTIWMCCYLLMYQLQFTANSIFWENTRINSMYHCRSVIHFLPFNQDSNICYMCT